MVKMSYLDAIRDALFVSMEQDEVYLYWVRISVKRRRL